MKDNSGKECLIVSSDLGRNLIKQKDLVDYNLKLSMQLKTTLENDAVIRELVRKTNNWKYTIANLTENIVFSTTIV